MGAAAIHGDIIMAIDTDVEPFQAASPTDRIIHELQLYGHRPHQDEHDPRPLPDEDRARGALTDIFDALVSTLGDTRLEPDLEDLLWSTVNLFHRATDRVQRELDRNEDGQKRSQKEQDGSEVRSVELERLIAEGLTMVERRDTMEFFRDHAADLFERHLGSTWHPRSGSKVNHRSLTAAMIDSRDFLAAKRRVETEPLMPGGAKVAFAGGLDCNDHARIWDVLDKVHVKHPDMVLLHGASPKGAEFIASRWADTRKVAQSYSSRTGPVMLKPHPSSATISFCRRCRLVLSSFPGPESPIRRRPSVFRCGVLEGAHDGAFPEKASPLE